MGEVLHGVSPLESWPGRTETAVNSLANSLYKRIKLQTKSTTYMHSIGREYTVAYVLKYINKHLYYQTTLEATD